MTDVVSDHEMPEHYKSGYIMGHPKGLYMLFATEMWERFSYYGMRTLLIFYLTKHFLFTDGKASLIYGAYTALVYLVPVIGGVIADRYLGARKAVTFGAILLVIGHLGMAFEGPPAMLDGEVITRSETHLQIFFLSLAFIIAGVGFLKANISTIVGKLYAQNDPRRDSGFTIFYMGINLGAFIATLACGYIGETYGWRYGFGLAGIGMLLGLIQFLRGQHLLEGHAEAPDPDKLKEKVFAGLSREWMIYLGGFLMVAVSWQLVQHQDLVGGLLGLFGAAVALIVLSYSMTKCSKVERDQIWVALVLVMFSVLFWALFEQAGSSLNLFTDRVVDRQIFGWTPTAGMFQSLNAGFIFMLAPVFAWGWVWLARRGWEPNTPVKFSLGILQVGLGFLLLVMGIKASGDGMIGLWWIVGLYLLHTSGELCLSPVGLSMITKLSPMRIGSMMMGVWFLASAGANFIAGLISRMTSTETHGGAITDVALAKATYIEVYSMVGWYAIGAAFILFLLSFVLRRGMHGVH